MTCRSWTPARRGPGTAQKPVSSTRGIPFIVGQVVHQYKCIRTRATLRRSYGTNTSPVALIRIGHCCIPSQVNRLIEYLRQHLMIDFQGDLTVAKVREL